MDHSAGDNIEQHAEDADRQLEEQSQRQPTSRVDNDEAHLIATRWWFASSAFPMIAGTLGPVASAFSICSLAKPWRQVLPPGIDVTVAEYVRDPVWLNIINGVQLFMAVVSNMFLLLNMTRRVRFTIAQPITIVGWYISAVCLLALNATAAGPLLDGFDYPYEEHVWSQGFYYGIWAAILYFLTASLMVVTFYGAWTGRYSKDFVLSNSQRTLMLQTIAFLLYLLLGALVFSYLEEWDYLDAVYWADVTLFTVGFGDMTPTSNVSKALMMPYSLIGIITIGLVIGSIRSMILERGKRRMDSRMEEKKRHQVVKTMVKRGADTILRPMSKDGTTTPDIELSPNEMKFFKRVPTNEFERRQQEFNLMREIQRRATVRRRWIDLGISITCWLTLWLIGALVFMTCEDPYQDWSYYDSFYFCFVSFVTIGYGDNAPISNAGRSFFVFWSMLALPTMTVLISNAGDTIVKFIKDATLSLGSVTILPGEGAFRDDLKHVIHNLSLGRLFPSHHQRPDVSPSRRSIFNGLDNDSNASSVNAGSASARTPARDPLAPLPEGPDFHYLLASEIQRIAKHLKDSKPRRYSFEEWAWYLKLIGEDEQNPELHRGPRPQDFRLDPSDVEAAPQNHSSRRRRRRHKKHGAHRGHKHGERGRPSFEEHARRHSLDRTGVVGSPGEEHKWSWVGTRNPLMGSKEESEWIMERLTERLKEAIDDDRGKWE